MPNSNLGKLVVAIDGPAGAGKSTVAQKVADALGCLYLDTGAMYRAVTWLALQNSLDIEDTDAIVALANETRIEIKPKDETSGGRVRVYVNGKEITKEIRMPEVSAFVSPVSTIAGVRKTLLEQQRKIATTGGAVLEGRDIGTAVLPNADVKIYLTASADVRTHRRINDLAQLGQQLDYDSVLKDIRRRDEIDSTRKVDPLRKADDAIEVDTDHLSIEEVVEAILQICRDKFQSS